MTGNYIVITDQVSDVIDLSILQTGSYHLESVEKHLKCSLTVIAFGGWKFKIKEYYL